MLSVLFVNYDTPLSALLDEHASLKHNYVVHRSCLLAWSCSKSRGLETEGRWFKDSKIQTAYRLVNLNVNIHYQCEIYNPRYVMYKSDNYYY